MDTYDFEHGIVYFKQFGAERVKRTFSFDNVKWGQSHTLIYYETFTFAWTSQKPNYKTQ